MRYKELLVEYNILNVKDAYPEIGIDVSVLSYIEELIPRVNNPDSQRWLAKNLKKYLINDEESIGPGSLYAQSDQIPAWAREAAEQNNLHIFYVTDQRRSEIDHIIDWFNTMETDAAFELAPGASKDSAEWNKKVFASKILASLSKVSYEDAVVKSNEYFTMFRSGEGEISNEDSILSFPDGHYWKEIVDNEDAKIAGADLGNCIGKEVKPNETTRIFTLVSSNSKCSVAISIKNDTHVSEIKGKGNQPPRKYMNYVVAFLNEFHFDATNTYDLGKINYIQIEPGADVMSFADYMATLPSNDMGTLRVVEMAPQAVKQHPILRFKFQDRYNAPEWVYIFFEKDDESGDPVAMISTVQDSIIVGDGIKSISRLAPKERMLILNFVNKKGLKREDEYLDAVPRTPLGNGVEVLDEMPKEILEHMRIERTLRQHQHFPSIIFKMRTDKYQGGVIYFEIPIENNKIISMFALNKTKPSIEQKKSINKYFQQLNITTPSETLKAITSEQITTDLSLRSIPGPLAIENMMVDAYRLQDAETVLEFSYKDKTAVLMSTNKTIITGMEKTLVKSSIIKPIISYLLTNGYRYESKDTRLFSHNIFIDEKFNITKLSDQGEKLIDFADGASLMLIREPMLSTWYHRQASFPGNPVAKYIVLYKDEKLIMVGTVSGAGFSKIQSYTGTNETNNWRNMQPGINTTTEPYIGSIEKTFDMKSKQHGLTVKHNEYRALDWIDRNSGYGVSGYYVYGLGNKPAGVPGTGSMQHVYTMLVDLKLVDLGRKSREGTSYSVTITPLGKKVLNKLTKDNTSRYVGKPATTVKIKKVYKENGPLVSKKFGKKKK